MATWPGIPTTDKSYHAKEMDRFHSFFNDPTTIVHWDFSDQAMLIIAMAVAAFAFYSAAQGFVSRKKNQAESEIPLSAPITYLCVGTISLLLPYLWTF